jgi:hypothetical protein
MAINSSHLTAYLVYWSEFLATDPNVLVQFPALVRFSEKQLIWQGIHSASWVQLLSYLNEKVSSRFRKPRILPKGPVTLTTCHFFPQIWHKLRRQEAVARLVQFARELRPRSFFLIQHICHLICNCITSDPPATLHTHLQMLKLRKLHIFYASAWRHYGALTGESAYYRSRGVLFTLLCTYNVTLRRQWDSPDSQNMQRSLSDARSSTSVGTGTGTAVFSREGELWLVHRAPGPWSPVLLRKQDMILSYICLLLI